MGGVGTSAGGGGAGVGDLSWDRKTGEKQYNFSPVSTIPHSQGESPNSIQMNKWGCL